MTTDPYRLLAERLDALPNGFPPTLSGIELRLLAKLFSPEEAELASHLRLSLETADEIAKRIGDDPERLRKLLKGMARRGLITAGKGTNSIGYKLMPFVVGIYEMQGETLDAELAELFEQYFKEGFHDMLKVEPSVHRVIPVNESIQAGIEVHPFESAAQIVENASAWGVIDCICRKQKALIGEPCSHPIDVCMTLSTIPGVYDNSTFVRALTKEEAVATLERAAEAGLVHSVSNNQKDVWYICNCCTCSCGVLRGISELGVLNAVAHSSFRNRVDEDLCILCGDCIDHCQFHAISLEEKIVIDILHCTGCGVCVHSCPEGALHLIPRETGDTPEIPENEQMWMRARAHARNIDLNSL